MDHYEVLNGHDLHNSRLLHNGAQGTEEFTITFFEIIELRIWAPIKLPTVLPTQIPFPYA